MNLAQEKPFSQLTNQQVVQNAEHMYYGGELQVWTDKNLHELTSSPKQSFSVYRDCPGFQHTDSSRTQFLECHPVLVYSPYSFH